MNLDESKKFVVAVQIPSGGPEFPGGKSITPQEGCWKPLQMITTYSTGGMLETTPDANFSIGGMLETTLNANYSTGGMLETTLDFNYSIVEMLETTQDAITPREGY